MRAKNSFCRFYFFLMYRNFVSKLKKLKGSFYQYFLLSNALSVSSMAFFAPGIR